MNRADPLFPVGQARLEALGVLACACIMAVASFQARRGGARRGGGRTGAARARASPFEGCSACGVQADRCPRPAGSVLLPLEPRFQGAVAARACACLPVPSRAHPHLRWWPSRWRRRTADWPTVSQGCLHVGDGAPCVFGVLFRRGREGAGRGRASVHRAACAPAFDCPVVCRSVQERSRSLIWGW
jgi:hypothetical protein